MKKILKEKVLVFIPYQDSDNYYSEGIMTREFALLYLLKSAGYKEIINVKKPRTFLDKKRYTIDESSFPKGTIENNIKNTLDKSVSIQSLPLLSLKQITEKRCWWIDEYEKYIKYIKIQKDKDYLIYSNNPFAWKFIKYLHEKDCKIYFDIMDNFSIHPSLNKKERNIALEGYKNILKYADIISANSKQTCDYMQKYAIKDIILVKNGVFQNNSIENPIFIDIVRQIREQKSIYKKSVGYIGKLGLRLDADLIDYVSEKCSDTLFVFVGSYLKGQVNDKLKNLFKNRKNIIHFDAVPSAFVFSILDEFDILSIPHSVGKNENGGDPLKLYQYLTRNKPIITTPILGVDEFKEYITISSNYDEWVKFINTNNYKTAHLEISEFLWKNRMDPILYQINN